MSARRVIKPKASVYRISGTLAALVKESVWSLLLKGEPVGVWETDHDYWTLFCNGTVVETVQVPVNKFGDDRVKNSGMAVQQFSKKYHDFRADALAMCNHTKIARVWTLRQGYPNIIHLSPQQIAQHEREKMTDRKLAERMRTLIRQAATMDKIKNEMKFGLKREGRDA